MNQNCNFFPTVSCDGGGPLFIGGCSVTPRFRNLKVMSSLRKNLNSYQFFQYFQNKDRNPRRNQSFGVGGFDAPESIPGTLVKTSWRRTTHHGLMGCARNRPKALQGFTHKCPASPSRQAAGAHDDSHTPADWRLPGRYAYRLTGRRVGGK